MAKRTVAVYDGSDEYIRRFLKYANRQNCDWMELKGFSELQALKTFLDGNRVDILLFSVEETIEAVDDEEEKYDEFIYHENVKKFVYLGERRNSRSRIRHINKYQTAEGILRELQEILLPQAMGSDEQQKREGNGVEAELVGIYSPLPEKETARVALEIADILSIEREVLYLDLERYSIMTDDMPETASGLSDLIYYYKTNPRKLPESLSECRRRYNNLDFLKAPEDLEDLDEIQEKDWPEFLRKLAESGNYNTVVVHMSEVFRNLEHAFESFDRVCVPFYPGDHFARKMYLMANHLCGKGRKDLYNKVQLYDVRNFLEPETEPEDEEEELWNW